MHSHEEAVFHAARKITAPDDRAAYLAEVCGDDQALRERIEALLAVHDSEQSFLKPPSLASTVSMSLKESVGSVIGHYKLLEQIGEGGMGVVFVAEQTEPVRRKVALKIIKPGMDTKQVIARFEAERQALAMMDHPNIARVLDAGATEDGRPYFVMELVRGVPITEYCDTNTLTTRQRLELFVHVCQAVQHAHLKGIIHRDIKPSNVLVTLHDGVPVIKVIDFGIAKATSGQLTDKTIYTGFAQMIGTPLYMSPEQAEMSGLDIDTRSDIYSLGVLLYELLTGVTPFDKETFEKAGYDEMRRIIREVEPQRPSARISTIGKLATTISEQRKSEPHRLSALFRRELDWIVMKALEKDRNRRYETANTFAADVKRYLHDEAVQACPPSTWYRFCKFVRRKHGILIATAVGILFVTLLAIGVGWLVRDREARYETTKQLVEIALDESRRMQKLRKWSEALAAAKRAKDILDTGEHESYLERQVNQRLTDMKLALGLQELIIKIGVSGTWRTEYRKTANSYEVLFRIHGIDIVKFTDAEAADRIECSEIQEHLVNALFRWCYMRCLSVGDVGRGFRSNVHWKDPKCCRLIAIARLAQSDPLQCQLCSAIERRDMKELDTLAASVDVAKLSPAIVVLLSQLLESGYMRAELLESAHAFHPKDFWINGLLGSYFRNHWQRHKAIRYYSAACAVGDFQPFYYEMGAVFDQLRQYDSSILAYRHGLRLKPDDLATTCNLILAHSRQCQYDDAMRCFQQAINLMPDSSEPFHSLGVALLEKGDLEGAIQALSTAIKREPDLSGAHNNLGVALRRMGKPDAAIAAFAKAVQLNPTLGVARINLGIMLSQNGDFEKASTEYKEAIRLIPDFRPVSLDRGLLDKALDAYNQVFCFKPKSTKHIKTSVSDCEANRLLYKAIARYKAAMRIRPNLAAAYTKNYGSDPGVILMTEELPQQTTLATRLYEEVFTARPSLANDLRGHRYNAACASVLAAAGYGSNVANLNAPERIRWRRQGLKWLRADLNQWIELVSKSPQMRGKMDKALRHWQIDPNLGSVRESVALLNLTATERVAWEKLWADVASALLN